MKVETFADIAEEIDQDRSTNRKERVMIREVFEPDTFDPEEVEIFARMISGSTEERFGDPDQTTNVSDATVRAAASEVWPVSETEIDEEQDRLGKMSEAIEAVAVASGQATLGSYSEMSDRTLGDIYARLEDLSHAGSDTDREQIVRALLSDCESGREAKWVSFCVLNDLSLYMGPKTVMSAYATTMGINEEDLRLAKSLTYDDLGRTIRRHLEFGQLRSRPEVGIPFAPMLGPNRELSEIDDRWVAQPKYDGARVLIHSDGHEITVFSRNGGTVRSSLPEITENVDPQTEWIVDGEAIAYDPETGDPMAFQNVMRRFRREHDIDEIREQVPLQIRLFDLVRGRDADHTTPFEERYEVLRTLVSEEMSGPIRITPTSADLDGVWESALQDGHEGIIARNRYAPYRFERDGEVMAKIKPDATVDLRISDVERGDGENAQRLGRIYVETRDGTPLGRTGNGFSDDERERWDPIDGKEITGKIAEIEAEEIAVTDHGYGIRFPRIKAIRDPSDATPDDLDRCLDLLN